MTFLRRLLASYGLILALLVTGCGSDNSSASFPGSASYAGAGPASSLQSFDPRAASSEQALQVSTDRILPRGGAYPVSLTYSKPVFQTSGTLVSSGGTIYWGGVSQVDSSQLPPLPSSISIFDRATFFVDTQIRGNTDDDGVSMTFGPSNLSGIPSGPGVSIVTNSIGQITYRPQPFVAPDGTSVATYVEVTPFAGANTRFRRGITLTTPVTGVFIANATASAFDGSSGQTANLDFDIILTGDPKPTVNQWTVSIVQANNTTNQPFYSFPVGSDSRGPGTATAGSSGIHVNLPWNGRDSQNNSISGDFSWVMTTNVTSSTSAPGAAGAASLRLDQVQKSLKINNAVQNPSNYDPISGENVSLTFDLESLGLGSSPNFDWNVAIVNAQGSELFVFPEAPGSEGPGNVTSSSSTSRHVTLSWNGLGSSGSPVTSDFSWSIYATASRPVAGGGGDLEVARAEVPNSPYNLEIYDSSGSSGKLLAKSFYDSQAQRDALLTETHRGNSIFVRLKNFANSNNDPIEITLRGQRSDTQLRKILTKQGEDYVVSLSSSELKKPPNHSLYRHDAGKPPIVTDSDLFGQLFRTQGGTTFGYSKTGSDPGAVGPAQLPVLPASNAEFPQDSTLFTLNNIRSGGYEIVQVKFTPVGKRALEARFRLRNSAEVRYYSGHGWHGANCLWGVTDPSSNKGEDKSSCYYGGPHTIFQKKTTTPSPTFLPVETQELATPEDFVGAKLWVIAGCSILDVFDLNRNFKYAHQFTRGWQDGEEWFNLAGGKNKVTFCGYNYEGAPDSSGTPEKVLKDIYQNLGANVKDYSKWPTAWMMAHIRIDAFDNACAIGTDGLYHYVKFDETVAFSQRPFGGKYYVHHANRSYCTLDYSVWGNKNYSLEEVNRRRSSLRGLYTKKIQNLPDRSFYTDEL